MLVTKPRRWLCLVLVVFVAVETTLVAQPKIPIKPLQIVPKPVRPPATAVPPGPRPRVLPDLRFGGARVSGNPPRVQFSLQNIGQAASTPNCVVYVFSRLSSRTLNVAVRSIAPGRGQSFNAALPIDASRRRADGNYGGTVVTLQIMHRALETSTRNNQVSVSIPRTSKRPAVERDDPPERVKRPGREKLPVAKNELHRRVLEFRQHVQVTKRTSWLSYFNIDQLTPIAAAGDWNKKPASKQVLIESLAKFDSVKGNAAYRDVLKITAFANLYSALQKEVGMRVPLLPGAVPLAGGALLYRQSGEMQLTHDVEILPDASDTKLTFWWDVTKVPDAGAVVWQIGRSRYTPLGGKTIEQPLGLLLSRNAKGAKSSFQVDFATVTKNLGNKSPPNSSAKEDADDTSPPNQQGSIQRFVRAGGSIVFHVRAIPVASTSNLKPIGLPTNVIRVFFGKMPKTSPDFEFAEQGLSTKHEPDTSPKHLRVARFQYDVMKTYCDAHSNKSHCGTFKGGDNDGLFDFVEDAWDWTCTAYQDVKKAVVSTVAAGLNEVLTKLDDDLKIPESVLMTALDSAMVAAGIPPTIPNLNDVVEMNADYLAGKIVEETGVPGPLADEARQRIKDGLIEGANEVANRAKGSKGTPCNYVTDPPHFVVTIENVGDKVYNDVHVHLFPLDLFGQRTKSIPSLRPGERIAIPFTLPQSQADKYWDGALYSQSKWRAAYNNEKFAIAAYIKAIPAGSNQTFPLHVASYTSRARVWNEPFVEEP